MVTNVTVKSLWIDTDLNGLEKFPSDYLSSFLPSIIADSRNLLDIKERYVVTNQKIPELKSLSYVTHKVHLTLQNSGELYEFNILDKISGSKINLKASSIEFRGLVGDRRRSVFEEWKFFTQFVTFID